MNTPISISQQFESLYLKSRAGLVTLANSYTENRVVAEDIVTDSFVVCWLKREEITTEIEFKKYLCGVIKKKCLEYLRNKQNQHRIQNNIFNENYRMLQYQITSLGSCNPEKMLVVEILAIYKKQLSKMSELTRNIFLASRNDELSYKEIAEKYDISVRKVTFEIQRALVQLRLSFKDYLPSVITLILCINLK